MGFWEWLVLGVCWPENPPKSLINHVCRTLHIAIYFMAMAKACLDVNELAEKSGVPTATLVQVKGGRQSPRPKTIGKLARALNVPVEELLEDT